MAGSAEPAAACRHGCASWVIVAAGGSSFLTSSHCAGTGCWVSGKAVWVGCCTSCPEDSTSCAKSPRSSQTVAGIFVLLFGSLSPHPHMDSPWADLPQYLHRHFLLKCFWIQTWVGSQYHSQWEKRGTGTGDWMHPQTQRIFCSGTCGDHECPSWVSG